MFGAHTENSDLLAGSADGDRAFMVKPVVVDP